MRRTHGGDTDIAQAAALFAEPARARVLLALADGRALPASVLAAEAGLSPSAASAHLARLREAGLISVEHSGRHRYHRLAGDHVAAVLESLAAIAPAEPIRSLKQGTRAAAVRYARTCYDHLAGHLGVVLTAELLRHRALVATDGITDTRRRPHDALSAPLHEHPYRLGPDAEPAFAALGVDLDAVRNQPGRRPLLRFCLDWSEQHHHLAGRLGAAMLAALLDARWLTRTASRAVKLTEQGNAELQRRLGIRLESTVDGKTAGAQHVGLPMTGEVPQRRRNTAPNRAPTD